MQTYIHTYVFIVKIQTEIKTETTTKYNLNQKKKNILKNIKDIRRIFRFFF